MRPGAGAGEWGVMVGREVAAAGAAVERAWDVRKAHTRSAIEESSLRLFAERGFDDTTVEELAEAAGVARRTFFRYFPSKNDVIFGSYEEHLDILRSEMRAVPAGTPAVQAVHRGFRAANDYRPDEFPTLAIRIRLMLEVPSLRAHAAWRYAGYERAVAESVAAHVGEPSGLYASALARASIGVMWAAYAHWLAQGAGPGLGTLIDQGFTLLTTGFPDPKPPPPSDKASG